MLIKDKKTGDIIEPIHRMGEYIKLKLEILGWQQKELAEKAQVSTGEVSKLIRGTRDKLSPKAFYSIYTAFGDSFQNACSAVYPDLDLSLGEYKEQQRNDFGKYMSTFEVIKNSIETISTKTGIELQRLKELYYLKGSPEAFELILIEKAINKKSGEVFEELYGDKGENG